MCQKKFPIQWNVDKEDAGKGIQENQGRPFLQIEAKRIQEKVQREFKKISGENSNIKEKYQGRPFLQMKAKRMVSIASGLGLDAAHPSLPSASPEKMKSTDIQK